MEKPPSIVADIMSSPVVTVDIMSNVRDAALVMTDEKVGCLIVVEGGNPVGIVTKSDIIKRVVSSCLDPCDTQIKDIMTASLINAPKELDILSAMRIMRQNSITQLGVLDGEDLVGIVSERDIIGALSIAALTSFSSLLRKRG